MPTTLTIGALNKAALAIGKGKVFYSTTAWDGVTDLTLQDLGETEGDISFDPGETIATLTLPERYGPGVVKAYVSGANPVATIPLYLDPDLRDVVTPSGDGKIGVAGRRPVALKTLVIFPHELFFNSVTDKHDAKLKYTTGVTGWQKSAVAAGDPDSFVALTAAEQDLLSGFSIWIYEGYFSRAPVVLRHGDPATVGKNLESIQFTGTVPEATAVLGIMATIGPPDEYAIEIDVP
jgi:hypothetical protein